jgi:threonine/homoserine/homoserine lactone efflux protein
MPDVVAFLAIAVIVIVTPGQDTALTIRNSLSGRAIGGVATSLGVASGQGIWTIAAATGLAALLVASEPVFEAVRLFGAAYLIYLGAQSLIAAWRGHRHDLAISNGKPLAPATAFRQGFISLGNPKMVIFFTSLLPQFVDQAQPTLAPLLALGLMFCAMTFAWLSLYSLAVDRAGDFIRRSSLWRVIDSITGVILTAFGIRLAAEKI